MKLTKYILFKYVKKKKKAITWNLDSQDWNPYVDSVEEYKKNLSQKNSKEESWIALNHDIQKLTAKVNLKLAIPYIRKLGYHFVTMEECTGISPYQYIPGQEILNSNLNSNSTKPNNNTIIEKIDNDTINSNGSTNLLRLPLGLTFILILLTIKLLL